MRAMCSGGGEMSVTLYAWMWEPEGLGLGHGADLIVYAALFDLTDAGTGVYARPCSELARLLGYSRETVQRSLTHLLALDVVWSPDGRASSSGTPRTYAISPGPLGRARKATGAEAPMAPIAPMAAAPSMAGTANGNTGSTACGGMSPQSVTTRACDGFAEGVRPTAVMGVATCDEMSVVRPAAVENSPVIMPACDELTQVARPSCDTGSQLPAGCDVSSRGVTGTCDDMRRAGCAAQSLPPDRHTPENAVRPAETPVFDTAHISSCLLSPDMSDMNDDTRWLQGTQMSLPIDVDIDAAPQGPGSSLTPPEIAAFESLVTHSLLPVDDAFLERNLAAFEQIVASGTPADAIVEAYDDYADYQRNRYRQTGTWRPMHLLHWLEMSPNGNIDYVMRKRELQALRGGTAGATGTLGTAAVDRRQEQVVPARRRGPRLTLCRDRGRALWFVDDDHGSRRVEGAEGIEDTAEATRIYERMYARECREAMRAA